MAEILKVLELAQNNRVAEMQVGSSRVHAELHAQRLSGSSRLLQLGTQVSFADDFGGALLEIRQLFVDRLEG